MKKVILRPVAVLAGIALPIASLAQTHNYAEALQKALFFYEAQTSGRLPLDHRVEWRGDSCTRDGQDVGQDLSGGWYDAGDGVVWTGNDAFGATLLAWSLIRYPDAFRQTAQYQIAIDRVREISDYLEKIVVLNSSGQVERIYCGKGATRHEPPDNPAPTNDRTEGCPNEVMDSVVGGAPQAVRPSYWVDATTGGADVAGAVAAALAANSIALRQAGAVGRADALLSLARKVYNWGEANPNRELVINGVTTRKGTRRITLGAPVTLADYPGRLSSWTPRMIFAAAWLHRAELAAGTPGYTAAWVDKAEVIYNSDENADKRLKHWVNFATGSPQNGAYAMLAADTGRAVFVTEASRYANFWLYDRSNHTGRTTDPTVTPDGFIARGQSPSWNIPTLLDQAPPLLDWADSSFNTNATQKAHLVALFTGTYDAGNRECPIKQIDYILGSNSRKLSYLQGYRPPEPGYTWVRNLHYRATMWAYGGFGTPTVDKPAWNRYPAYGTLAPGPDHTDYYPQDVPLTSGTVIGYQEPIIYSGGLLTVLARNYLLGGPAAGQPLPVFPSWEPRPSDYQTASFFVSGYKDSETRFQLFVNNRATLPPREINTLGFRYYFTPDGVAGSQVSCVATGIGLLAGESVAVAGPFEANGQWYFEVRLVNAMIVPGEYKRYQRRVQLDFSQPSGTFNPANDHSGAALDSTDQVIANIPVYDTAGGPGQWKLLGGFEPSPGYIQWRRAHFNNTWESAPEVELIAERVGGTVGAVSATVTLSPGTAGVADFGAPANPVLSWAAGEYGERTIRIPLLDDPYDEGREYFTATLGAFTGGAAPGITTTARVSIEDDDFGGPPDPGSPVRVLGNGLVIANGDTSPSLEDHTHFGDATVGAPSAAVTRTFTVRNLSSTDPLILSGTPLVAISGAAAADYTVTALPTTPIPPGGETAFSIRFEPTANGSRNATLSLSYAVGASSSTYSFAISGTGSGAQPAAALSHTEMVGSVPPGGVVTSATLTIYNNGYAPLTWNATLPTNYTAITSTEPGGPAYEWIDITSPGPNQGTVITSWGGSDTKRDDKLSNIISIGFDFPFYGSNRNQIKVSDNGFLTFTTNSTSTGKSNAALPSSNFGAASVAVWWDDLVLLANRSDVYYRRVDADTFVVTWYRVAYDKKPNPVGDMSFQAILKRDGRIICQYKNVTAPVDGNGYTIGIQNSTSDPAQALQYAYNTKTAEEGVAIEFRPPCTGFYDPAGSNANWLAMSSYSGTVAPLSSATVTVYFDGNGLVSGSAYVSRITLTTNDPARPALYLPVSLVVSRAYNLEAYDALNRPWEQTSTWTPSFAFPGAHDDLDLATAGGSLRIDGPRSINRLTLRHANGLTLVGTRTDGSGAGATLFVNGLATLLAGDLRAGGSTARLRFNGGLLINGGTLGFAAGASGSIEVPDETPVTLQAGTLDALVVTGGGVYSVQLGEGDLLLAGPSPVIRVATETYALSRRLTGAGGFRKTGAGALVLAAPGADHSGVTDVAEGVLRLGAVSALSPNSKMRLSGGTLATAGFSAIAGPLELAASSVLDFSGGGALQFADSSSQTWASATLAIVNFDPANSVLRFGTTANGLTSAQLAKITLNGEPLGSWALDADGYLRPMTATSFTWNADGNGNWSDMSRWSPSTAVPNDVDVTATFGPVITAARVVTLNQNATVGTLIFNEDTVGANAYTVSFEAGRTLTFRVSTGVAELRARGSGGYALGTQGQGTVHLFSPLAISAGSAQVATGDGATIAISSQITGPGGLTLSSLNSNDGTGEAVNGTRGTALRSTIANSFTGGVTVNSGYLMLAGNIGNAGAGDIVLNASDSSNGGIGTNLRLKTGGGVLPNRIVFGNPNATGGGSPRLGWFLYDSSAANYTHTGGLHGQLGNQTLRFATAGAAANSLRLQGNGTVVGGTGATVHVRKGRLVLDHANALGVGNALGSDTSGGLNLGDWLNNSTDTAELLTNGYDVRLRVTTTQGSGTTHNDHLVLGGIHTSGVATFHRNIALGRITAGERQLRLTSAAGGTTVFAGVISDSGSSGVVLPVRIVGAGRVILTGANTYAGGTTVESGVLLANNTSGSATGSGAVTVRAGAKFGGTGTVSGNVTCESGARLIFELAAPPTSFDRLDIGGTLALNGTPVELTAGSTSPASGEYVLAQAASIVGLPGEVIAPTGYVATAQVVDNQLRVSLRTVLEDWRSQYFGSPANSGDGADIADPDNDGFPNLVEYALGTVPSDSASRPLVGSQVTGNGLTITFTPQVLTGLSYWIEASNDLFQWETPVDVTANLVVGQPYTYYDGADVSVTSRRFLRVRIVSNP